MVVANWSFFGKSHRGDRPLAWPKGWAFLFSEFIYLNYDFGRGMSSLALILPLIGSLAQKKFEFLGGSLQTLNFGPEKVIQIYKLGHPIIYSCTTTITTLIPANLL